jgi:pSer/pThr/pTyr-binding forkhead associated (FHA) protein
MIALFGGFLRIVWPDRPNDLWCFGDGVSLLSYHPAMVMSLRIGHRRYVLARGVNTIGRDPESSICLNDSSVSRAHARITITDGQAAVEDLRSKNGTTVQNQPITGPVILADGDEIEFGHVKGWFIIEAGDDQPTTTHL